MISSLEQITKPWLQARLVDCGFKGEVATLAVTPAHASGKSDVFHLQVEYRDRSGAPEKFFLKLLSHAKAYRFHTEMKREMISPALIPVYEAAFDFAIGKGYLLMADLSGSHYQTEWPLPPSLEDCRAALDVLANIHAHWWGHPRLRGDLAEWVVERHWQTRLLETASRVEGFIGFLGDRLAPERQQIYRQLASGWPELVETRQKERPLTVTHCDAHAWNFLFPLDRQNDRTVLFDWTNWDISTATDDLAYFMGLHWYPDRRGKYENELLRYYYQRLVDLGVEAYGWEECQQDYRRSVLRAMLIPVWQWEVGISASMWWPHLERGILTYEDLGCCDLFA